jgi:hypothetical protein
MFGPKTAVAILVLLIAPARCLAVNFYDGARAPQGMYFLTYSSLYSADTTTDAAGDTAKRDYGYSKLEELLRLCYYKGDLALTAFAAAGNVRSDYYDNSSGGLGDINLGAGWFLPVKQADILPMIFVKFPTAEYDRGKTVNYGTNQYDIKPTVFLYKQLGRFSIDAAVKYFIRLENPVTDIAPDNELHLQCLLGWNFAKCFKAGPSVNWYKSSKQKISGASVDRSQRQALAAGSDVYFRLPICSVTLTYLHDVYSKNTTKGDFFQVKTCSKF